MLHSTTLLEPTAPSSITLKLFPRWIKALEDAQDTQKKIFPIQASTKLLKHSSLENVKNLSKNNQSSEFKESANRKNSNILKKKVIKLRCGGKIFDVQNC